MGDAIGKHRGKVAAVLAALWPEEEWQDGVAVVLGRADKIAVVIAEEGDKADDPFPSALIEHLIDTTPDLLAGTKWAFGWL
jgi:hypothetical protein